MHTTSPRAPSPAPTTSQLTDRAHHAGLTVRWIPAAHPRMAAYAHTARTIWLRHDLTDAEARSLLAHELGHHHYGDHGPQPPHVEARAWRYAASLLITPHDYAAAEALDHRVPALADALHVTAEVIVAYQDLLERNPRCVAS